MEVKRGHQYQGERAIKSDLTSMVGPVYNSGKATQHKFTGGYIAPKARTDQVELVNKFFKRETNERTETVQTQQIENVTTKVESKVEFSSGEDRRKEAIGRRHEFLKQQEDLHMQVKSSEIKVSNVKSRQQLEEEREAFFKKTVMRVQEEASMLSNRAKEEEMKRIEWLKNEEERMQREEILRQEAMVRAEEERRQREAARQEELKRQKLELAKQREEQERLRLAKLQEEEEERRKQQRLRRQEELKRLEKQRLEQMIIQESKVVGGHVSKRVDDVHGLGWGNVKTGFVSKKKLGFLQREMSVDRDSNSSSPVGNGKGRGLRVTFADSPTGSRPASNLGWTDVRAQTPPLAGEWSATASTSTSASASSTQQVAT